MTIINGPTALSSILCPARRWNCVPDTATDMTSAIQAAFDGCPAGATLVFEPGTYDISNTVVLDNAINIIADGVTLDLDTNTPTGTIATGVPENHNGTSYLTVAQREAGTLVDTVALHVKGSGSARLYRNFVRGFKVIRTAANNTKGARLHLGIVLEAPYESYFEDLYATNFFGGIVCTGLPAGGGYAYNNARNLSSLNCRYGLTLYTCDSGYVNQNTFEGGRHQISSAVRSDAEWNGGNEGVEWEYIRVLWESSSGVSPANGNIFVDVTLENEVGRKLRLEGADNQFINCRWEGYRTHSPLTDITIGESSRTGSYFARNQVLYGSQLQNIVGSGQYEFLASGGSANIGNSIVSGAVNLRSGLGAGAEQTAHIFANGNSTYPVLSVANSSIQQVIKLYHVYSSLSAQGTMEFLDTGGTLRNALGMITASPYDLRTLAGVNTGNVFRVRPSTNDALIANPLAGLTTVHVASGWEFYASSTNTDLIRLLDSSQNEKIIAKSGSTDWGGGHYGIIEFWNATPARENAILLLSTAFGATRPICVQGSVWLNRSGGANLGRFRGSGITSLMEWDAVNDRVGINTTSPDTLFHVNGAAHVGSDIEIDGALNHDGSTVGFFGTTPATKPSAYTPSNVTTDRTYDANATTVDELADVLGTLIADLQTLGLIG